jgi:hypothetical protein
MDVDGRLEGVQRYLIHGTPYFRVYFSLSDAPDDIQQAQLPFDAFDETLTPGDAITITFLLKTVMKVERAASR